MAIHQRLAWNATVLIVEGDLDFHSHRELDRAMYAAAVLRPKLIVSLEDCSYCDVCGLRSLVAAKRWLGSRLEIVIPADHAVRRIVGIVAWEASLLACGSLGEALLRCTPDPIG